MFAAVGLPPASLRRGDVERRVGMTHEEMVRWWRAMGFAEVPEKDVAFGEEDVRMATALSRLLSEGEVSDREVLRIARVLGASFSRIAEAQVDLIDRRSHGPDEAEDTGADLDRPQAERFSVDPVMLTVFESSLVYVWRRHLLAALGRRMQLGEVVDADTADSGSDSDGDAGSENADEVTGGDFTESVTVGFVDISGFSKMSKTMSGDDLADVVDSFEADALDVVGAHGSRVVKFIGDAVMFVAPDLPTGVRIGLELQERAADSEPPVDFHCGVARGPAVTMGGDVFGPTVNIASRLTDLARKRTVVVPRECGPELASSEDLVVRPVRRPYDLKGIGRTRVSTVRRAEDPDSEGVRVAEELDTQKEQERAERRDRRERVRAERRERKERDREEREREEREREERERVHVEEPAVDRPE